MVSRVRPFRDGGVLGLIYGAFFFGGLSSRVTEILLEGSEGHKV
jgi:hypothetical protein